MDAVRAEQKTVTGAEVDLPPVGAHLEPRANGPRQDVRERVFPALQRRRVRRIEMRAAELVAHRVVARELYALPLPPPVDAAVTYVRDHATRGTRRIRQQHRRR